MPNRVIKESIKTDAQIDSLTWFEEVVFFHLIVTADDYGCIDGRSALLKNTLFPLKESVTRKAIEDAISKLASVGLLYKYTVSGIPYLCFPTWEKHQRIRNKRSKYPLPSEKDLENNLSVNCQSIVGQMTASCPPESESNPNPNPESESKEIGAEQPCGRSTPPTAPSGFNIPLNDGSMYNVPLEDVAVYKQLYTAVDVEAELRGMIGWCMSNPKRRKTNTGIKSFITRWLKKTQDAGGSHKRISSDSQYAQEDDFY